MFVFKLINQKDNSRICFLNDQLGEDQREGPRGGGRAVTPHPTYSRESLGFRKVWPGFPEPLRSGRAGQPSPAFGLSPVQLAMCDRKDSPPIVLVRKGNPGFPQKGNHKGWFIDVTPHSLRTSE